MIPQHRARLCLLIAAALALITALPLRAQVLQTGNIAGTVRDAAGKPLHGVQITIVDTEQTSVTDANGYYIITSVLPGTHTVEASLVGYEPVQATGVVVTQEWTATVDLSLEQRTVTSLGTTRVQAPMIRKDVTPTLYTVTSTDEQLVRSTPDNLYQYPGAAISQPGVVPDSNGFPTIRGSRPYQVGYMLDGINLLQPGSGEFATNLATIGMDRMNIYTGIYRAELGGMAGGIVNSVVKTGASMRGRATVETSLGGWDYGSLLYEQGNVEANGLNWYVSGLAHRTDFRQNAQFGASPILADVLTKIIRPIGSKDRLTLLYTGGFQSVDVPETDPFTGQYWPGLDDKPDPNAPFHNVEFNDKTRSWRTTPRTLDYLNQSHHIGSLTWARALSPAANLSAQVYGWSRRKDLNAMSVWNSVDSKTDNSLLAGRLEYTGQLAESLQLRAGTEWIEGDNWDRRVLHGLASDIGAPGSQYRIRDADTTDRNAYLAATWRPGARLTMDLGVRYDSRAYQRYITEDEIAMGRASTQAADRAVLERTGMKPKYDATTPRFGLSYALNPATVLKASAGRFVQFASGNYLENRYYPLPDATLGGGNPNWYPSRQRKVFDVGPEKVNAVDLGIERQIGPALAVSVTPYWRKSTGMLNQAPSFHPVTGAAAGLEFTNIGFGHTRGVESKLTLRERNGLSGWVTYTYQNARGNNTVGAVASQASGDPDKEYRLDYDQRHTIYVVGRFRKGRAEINPMLELGSGYPWGGQMDVNTGWLGYGEMNGERLPILVNGRVESGQPNAYNTGWHDNLSVTFRLFTDDTRSSYYFLQIQNLLNSKDVTARYWQNPLTGNSLFGYVPGSVNYIDENGEPATASGHFEYKPWTRTAPIFVAVGVRKTF